ncbi:microcystin-dependent protein [Bradyrhizobium macuxiense]|uniref:Microcystin-dependent protein n=1 Tax=Bradyrhizobium macuxiense TaxID=1755647 RepID=A0A560LDJ4_9BRAD|nr:tail fiber protein [Bradyrhizobium macuxiense]TWB93435.1 microcystin-dependent protein [Bradyrhizobium macuxiense]
MADPFLAEIRMMSFNFPPKGWAFCNGQLLPINQNQALFSLLGTTFGGDGRVNFGLPDLQGRVPISMGSHTLGEKAGEQSHTLTLGEMAQHTHLASGSSTTAGVDLPGGNLLGNSSPNLLYGPASNLSALNPATISNVGGSQAHLNMQPYLTINFSIALQGIFPSQN